VGLPLPVVSKMAAHLGRLEHDLRKVVQVGQRAFGEPRGDHEHGGDLDAQAPRVHAVLGPEALGQDEADVHKALDKGEVPAIAAQAERPVRRTAVGCVQLRRRAAEQRQGARGRHGSKGATQVQLALASEEITAGPLPQQLLVDAASWPLPCTWAVHGERAALTR
jgi:hypothetical protein